MIVMDRPFEWPRKPGVRIPAGPSSHLMSDVSGPEGTAELLSFAARIGLQLRWIQHRGTYREHFDLFGGRIAKARSAGARELGPADFRKVLRARREAHDTLIAARIGGAARTPQCIEELPNHEDDCPISLAAQVDEWASRFKQAEAALATVTAERDALRLTATAVSEQLAAWADSIDDLARAYSVDLTMAFMATVAQEICHATSPLRDGLPSDFHVPTAEEKKLTAERDTARAALAEAEARIAQMVRASNERDETIAVLEQAREERDALRAVAKVALDDHCCQQTMGNDDGPTGICGEPVMWTRFVLGDGEEVMIEVCDKHHNEALDDPMNGRHALRAALAEIETSGGENDAKQDRDDLVRLALSLLGTLPHCDDDSGCEMPSTRDSVTGQTFCEEHGGGSRLEWAEASADLRAKVEEIKKGGEDG